MVDLEKSAAQILEAYGQAVADKDAESLIRLYEPKARIFDAWGVWSYEGSQAWQQAVEGWFSSLATERVVVSFDEIQVMTHGDFALVTAIVTYTGVSAQGDRLRSMQNRLTWGMKVRGHVLRIVHEHTSAPIGFEDMKAILQRHPVI